jgi:hypothetical protein
MRWDGSAWTPADQGLIARSGAGLNVNSIVALEGDQFVVGGNLMIEGTSSVGVARWDGQWRAYGDGVASEVVALTRTPGGEVIAAQRTAVLRWNGSVWQAAGTNNSFGGNGVYALGCSADGTLYVGGGFSGNMRRMIGTGWWSVPSVYSTVFCLAGVEGSGVITGGWMGIPLVGGGSSQGIGLWSGTAWQGYGVGVTDRALGVLPLDEGRVVATGLFWVGSDSTRSNIATWDGTAWQRMGTGLDGAGRALALHQNGDVIVVGDFSSAGGTHAPRVARWVVPTIDFNHDGADGADTDIGAFFACLSGNCCHTCGTLDFNGDGDYGTDQDIESFFRMLAGGSC